MRILLVGPKSAVGGFGRFVNDFCTLNLPAEVALHDTARPLKKNIRPYEIGTYATITNTGLGRLARSVLITFSHIVKFPHRLKQVNPDIVYCIVGGNIPFWDACPYVVLAWRSQSKIIFHWLGPLEPFYQRIGPFERRIVHLMLQRVDASFVLSGRDGELLSNLAPGKPLVYVPSSVDVDLFETAQALETLPDVDCFFDILFLGGVDPYRKGLTTLLDAVPLIITGANRPIRLIVTGGDACQDVIDHSEPQVRESVSFLGWVSEEDKYRLYKTCDLMVLPSFDEGMPYALVEAMAAGLPIVSTLVGGIPDLIQDGQNGFLISPGCASELADKTVRLVNDTSLHTTISETNHALARRRYSVRAMFQQIMNLCERLLADPQ